MRENSFFVRLVLFHTVTELIFSDNDRRELVYWFSGFVCHLSSR